MQGCARLYRVADSSLPQEGRRSRSAAVPSTEERWLALHSWLFHFGSGFAVSGGSASGPEGAQAFLVHSRHLYLEEVRSKSEIQKTESQRAALVKPFGTMRSGIDEARMNEAFANAMQACKLLAIPGQAGEEEL